MPVDLTRQLGLGAFGHEEFRHLAGDLLQLLDAILAEMVETKPDNLLDLFNLGRLGYDDDPNVLRLPSRPGARGRDVLLNALGSLCYLRHNKHYERLHVFINDTANPFDYQVYAYSPGSTSP